MKKSILLLVCIIIYTTNIFSQIKINEYSCSNLSIIQDGFGKYEDYVELINTGASTVNLAGYFLSDNPNNLQKWAIPSTGGPTTINAGAKKMIFCTSKDTVLPSGEIHPSFSLRQTYGEWIILSNPSGIVVDSLKLKLTQIDHSRGRITDGAATFGVFDIPNPNAPNVGAKTRYADRPIFNVVPGNYTTNQNITITTLDPLVTLRYTSNGTSPTTTSTVYSTPILVTADTVIRARAYSSDPMVLPSFIETNTYFINEVSTFDIISVAGSFTSATNQGNGYLFTGGFNYNEQVVSYEYFTNTGAFKYELDGLASRHGHDSWAYPQKGINMDAMDETGTMASHNHLFFNTTPRDTFDRIILKAAGSDNYAGGPNNSTHLRDVFAHTLAEKYNLDMDLRRWKPVLLFVNGRYWGVYDLRETVDNDYFKFYYNKDKKKVDHLSYWGSLQIRQGSDTGWNNLYNYIMTNPMSVQANYDHVKSFLDVKSFIQYFIFNEYLVNHDWLNWNTMWWRGRGTANNIKWKYTLWDEDAICGLNNPNYTGVGTTGPTNDPCEPTTLFQNDPDIKHTDMLTKLFNSPEFKQTYKDEWIDMLNGPFECQNILNHFDSVVNVLSPEMNRQALRWAGTFADWQANCTAMRAWITQRCAVIGPALDTCLELNPVQLKLNVFPANAGNIKLNNVLKVPYVWSKTIQGDTTYTLKATSILGPNWTFDHWESQQVANTFTPNMTTDSVLFGLYKKDSVIAYFVYKNLDSVDVTFDVNPPGTGTILLNSVALPFYPYTTTLDRRNNYSIEAVPAAAFKFVTWQKNNTNTTITPDVLSKVANFSYQNKETIVGNFDSIPVPPPIPPLPPINKDLFIPSAISPNNDGKNDFFKIQITADVIGLEIELYNRWGNKVFTSTSKDAAWDGTYKGTKAEIGVYQYMVKAKFRDNSTQLYKGDFTIIK